MKKLLLFGGTAEGRALAQSLHDKYLDITLCTATGYRQDLPARVEQRVGRLNREQMLRLMQTGGYGLTVDATHPYAQEATANIRQAAGQAGIPCLRLLREKSPPHEGIQVESVAAAVEYLRGTSGRVLLTSGAKDLAAFTALPNWQERLYARVLPALESLSICLELGFLPDHIAAQQGPFSTDLNAALIRQWGIEILVTKDGGAPGGFEEKAQAARQTGAQFVVIGRPEQEQGLPFDEALQAVLAWMEESQ